MKSRLRFCWRLLVPALAVSGFVFAAEDSIEAPPSLAVPIAESLSAAGATAFQETRNTASDARFNMDTRSGDTSEAFEAWLRERGLTVVGDTASDEAVVTLSDPSLPILLAARSDEVCQASPAPMVETVCVTSECLLAANSTPLPCQSAHP